MTVRMLGAISVIAASTAFTTAASAAECGSLSIAEMNWASAEMMANVDAIILEAGYGCVVTLVQGANLTIFASMNERGQPHVAPELWPNSVQIPLDAAKAEGRMLALNDGPITGLGEGWWVTPGFHAEYPELDTVEKLVQRPDLFPHPEDPSMGAFHSCPSGWACQMINANLFRAFGMDELGWRLIDPGSAAGLDASMARAAERGEPWFGYYWSPTAMIGRYDMVMLPFEAEWAGDDNWFDCMMLPVGECVDPQPSAWSAPEVETVVTTSFLEIGGPAVDYFRVRKFPSETINTLLVYMNEYQATGEDAAFEFLLNHEDVWTEWVPADVADRVRAAL